MRCLPQIIIASANEHKANADVRQRIIIVPQGDACTDHCMGIVHEIRQTNTESSRTLIFVNQKKMVDKVAPQLRKMEGIGCVHALHGDCVQSVREASLQAVRKVCEPLCLPVSLCICVLQH